MASAVPTFWIPHSIATVLLIMGLSWKANAATYPSASPRIGNRVTAAYTFMGTSVKMSGKMKTSIVWQITMIPNPAKEPTWVRSMSKVRDRHHVFFQVTAAYDLTFVRICATLGSFQ